MLGWTPVLPVGPRTKENKSLGYLIFVAVSPTSGDLLLLGRFGLSKTVAEQHSTVTSTAETSHRSDHCV